MTDYQILQSYIRMLEERERLANELQNARFHRLFTKTKAGVVDYHVRTNERNTLHEKKIDVKEYVKLYEENYNFTYISQRIAVLDARIRYWKQKIPEIEQNIVRLYNRQANLASMICNNFTMENKNLYMQEYLLFKTLRGEFVRSKYEGSLADQLFNNRILYEYEASIPHLGFSPDFYIKNNIRETPIIWEHFGKMNDPGYVQSYIKKMESFRKAGFYPGYNLITTFEFYDNENSCNNIIGSSFTIQNIIREWFLPEGIILPERLRQIRNIKGA